MTENTRKDYYDTKTIIIILLIIIAGLVFDQSSSFPSNCYRTPSTDVGGGEIECE